MNPRVTETPRAPQPPTEDIELIGLRLANAIWIAIHGLPAPKAANR